MESGKEMDAMGSGDSTVEAPRPPGRRPLPPVVKSKGVLGRKRVLFAGLIVVAALGYLGFNAFQSASMYYLTVGELIARGDAIYGDQVRVSGKVMEGSVQDDDQVNTLRFTMTDGDGARVPVVYQGIVPDTFKPGADVVVEGALTPQGVFEATSVVAKCPSKYEPASED